MIREEEMRRLVVCLMANNVGWLPETKEQWRAAEVLFRSNPRPHRGQGRPPEDEAKFSWTKIMMAMMLVYGNAKNGKLPIQTAAKFAADHLDEIAPFPNGDVHDSNTIAKRWDSPGNKYKGMLKDYVRREQPEWFKLCRKQIFKDITLWEVKFAREFSTLEEISLAPETQTISGDQ